MVTEAAGRGARAALLTLAAVFGAGAAWVAPRDTLPLPWLQHWTEAHPDPRPLTGAEAATLMRTLAAQRRDDALMLLGGIAVGCLALAAWPSLARAAGGRVPAVLAAGSVVIGLVAAAQSVGGQWQGARDGSWTLGDDSLPALAGPHAAALRAARDRTAPGDAVLIAGTNQQLFNAAAWAFDGRALYPVLQDVPDDLDVAAVRDFARARPEGAGQPRRWLLDLRALEGGDSSKRPALLELSP
jgi:hypothetical protein